MSDREKLHTEIARLEADNIRLQEIVEREIRNQRTLKVEQGEVFRAMQKDRDQWFDEAKRLKGELGKLRSEHRTYACRRSHCVLRNPKEVTV